MIFSCHSKCVFTAIRFNTVGFFFEVTNSSLICKNTLDVLMEVCAGNGHTLTNPSSQKRKLNFHEIHWMKTFPSSIISIISILPEYVCIK